MGLLPELIDRDGPAGGNTPQAFVHAGLISAAAAIDRAASAAGSGPRVEHGAAT